MVEFKNKATLSSPEIDAQRAAIEHRATWMALIYDEARKAGIENIEEAMRAAVRRTGHIHGERMRDTMADKDDFCSLCGLFLNPTAQKNFEQEVTLCSHDELAANFGYCAFISAWKKLNLSDEDIALLCDIAMEGDRGVADTMGAELDIPKRLSLGDDMCQIHFRR